MPRCQIVLELDDEDKALVLDAPSEWGSSPTEVATALADALNEHEDHVYVAVSDHVLQRIKIRKASVRMAHLRPVASIKEAE